MDVPVTEPGRAPGNGHGTRLPTVGAPAGHRHIRSHRLPVHIASAQRILVFFDLPAYAPVTSKILTNPSPNRRGASNGVVVHALRHGKGEQPGLSLSSGPPRPDPGPVTPRLSRPARIGGMQ
ncbi:hypothetical protein NITHO_3970003 [Nitrolancea hollandica Lb]|uniref:Uncharacterized protein n=1 Tax=Nitrolancea hollandica Lb TaxID=1129897 RepID=I4EJD3_9BACT|nr:hypothetical protein NITHO_3970003 [Nitrolancea hollandica Lb]